MDKRQVLKKSVAVIATVLLVAVLTCTLVGCMKIAMRESNIKKRITESGGACVYLKTLPFDYNSDQTSKVSVGSILQAIVMRNEEMCIVYIVFAKNDRSGDIVEEIFRNEKKEGGELESVDGLIGQNIADWTVYRYENIVMFGDYRALAVARGY